MKTQSFIAASALIAPAFAAGPPGGRGWGPGGPGGPGGFGPDCVNSCWNSTSNDNVNWSQGITGLCGNTTLIDSINSCIDSSSCSSSDKQGTYQFLAQVCANAGQPISASPEATFSATSGGSAYPTTGTYSAWQSYSSYFATATDAWATATTKPGWAGPGGAGGYGPFGQGGGRGGDGYGPWGKSGQWTSGPWTSWWGTSACPPSTWSGWTSGPWGTNAPWTTWTGCTASTTATSVVTSSVAPTNGTSGRLVTSTSFGLQLAQASNTAAASGATATGTSGSAKLEFERGPLAVAVVALSGVVVGMLAL